MVVTMGAQKLKVRCDSNLTISQINGDFNAMGPWIGILGAITTDVGQFDGLEFHHIKHDDNAA